ncbi:MAG: DUF2157 domain-containing protein [Polaromonas sp.]|nr:DUF2157 domain-containing protein [Polaromonas sp.]
MHELIHRLIAEFALPPGQAARLWQLSRLHAPAPTLRQYTERGLGVLAALLLGAGLIFWVAANWQAQTRQFRFLLIQALLLSSVLGALAWPRGRTALLLLATLALGGLLAFIGQTYQTGADPWQLFAAWAALALLWVAAARSDALWALWVLIAGTGMALWSGSQLMSPLRNLLGWHDYSSALMPLLWAGLLLVAWLVSRFGLSSAQDPAARGRYAFGLATLLALSAWCSYGLLNLFGRNTGFFWLNAALVVGAAALAYLTRPRSIAVLAMSVLALDTLLLGLLARLLFSSSGAHDFIGPMFVFGLVAAIMVGVSGTWIYKLQRAQAAA